MWKPSNDNSRKAPATLVADIWPIYIIAILFVIFDVETVFLFPWAVRYRTLGWFGVAEVAVFLAILVVGYIWAYKKGALEWV